MPAAGAHKTGREMRAALSKMSEEKILPFGPAMLTWRHETLLDSLPCGFVSGSCVARKPLVRPAASRGTGLPRTAWREKGAAAGSTARNSSANRWTGGSAATWLADNSAASRRADNSTAARSAGSSAASRCADNSAATEHAGDFDSPSASTGSRPRSRHASSDYPATSPAQSAFADLPAASARASSDTGGGFEVRVVFRFDRGPGAAQAEEARLLHGRGGWRNRSEYQGCDPQLPGGKQSGDHGQDRQGTAEVAGTVGSCPFVESARDSHFFAGSAASTLAATCFARNAEPSGLK